MGTPSADSLKGSAIYNAVQRALGAKVAWGRAYAGWAGSTACQNGSPALLVCKLWPMYLSSWPLGIIKSTAVPVVAGLYASRPLLTFEAHRQLDP